uniref:hypothetical protein n=1 Tax=Marinobacterium profundum TaxID=1714300 RepID=UPI000A922542|nr:hypothetical protein [Marinobacterium profundum]
MTSHISGGSFSFGGMLGGSLEDIKAFCAVIEFGSVSRAAIAIMWRPILGARTGHAGALASPVVIIRESHDFTY